MKILSLMLFIIGFLFVVIAIHAIDNKIMHQISFFAGGVLLILLGVYSTKANSIEFYLDWRKIVRHSLR